METCQHNNQIGDNYGLTCQDCGAVLAGYGYWAEGARECLHKWLRESDAQDAGWVCAYCEQYSATNPNEA